MASVSEKNKGFFSAPDPMSGRIFKRFSEFIYNETGIKLPETKKTMLEARIRKRLRKLQIDSFSEYCNYVFSQNGNENELIQLIDVVTTNKTDFFREPLHFEYLTQDALPELLKLDEDYYKKFKIWSAGCSTGEEAYTLAIVMSEFVGRNHRCSFSILATDICTDVLQKAFKGIYAKERVAPIPISLRRKYLLRNRDPKKKTIRIVPELRKAITFQRLNFMDKNFDIEGPVDIIFCRNVIIYFDKETQEELVNRFYRYIRPGGYLFIGHSETLHRMNIPLVQVAPTIYRRVK